MKLETALLCVQCDEVFEGNGICPKCLNRETLRIDKLIEGKPFEGILDTPEPEKEYCDGCHYLTLTEEEEAAMRKDGVEGPLSHRCSIHVIDIQHCGQHPRLPRPSICGKSYKKRED